MDRIVLDDAVIARAKAEMRSIEVYDSAGNVVGEFVPRINAAEYKELGPDISDDELLRRAKTERRYTTAEVIDFLVER